MHPLCGYYFFLNTGLFKNNYTLFASLSQYNVLKIIRFFVLGKKIWPERGGKHSPSPKSWIVGPLKLCLSIYKWRNTAYRKFYQWFSPSIPVSSTNKTDHHDITEVLLNTITLIQVESWLNRKLYNVITAYIVYLI